MGEYFFLNGKIVNAKDAYLHITDLALLRGFGVFDFCRTQNSIPLLIDRYLDRFFNSARSVDIEIPYSKSEIIDVIAILLEKNKFAEKGIRMIATGGYTENGYTPGDPNFFILIEKINFPETSCYDNGIKLMLHEHQRELSHIKSINYLTPISIRNSVKKAKAYDVLFHFGGNLLEVSRSNIFIVRDNTIITPSSHILKGITRSVVLNLAKELCSVEEREIPLQELYQAEEAFMTGTTKRVLPVRQIDDHIIGNGKPGQITQQIMTFYKEFENSFTILPHSGDQA
jgi:branched-subunit amino acid aminotransferase/4-amino-4-deoxychorismate lyase